MRFVFKTGIAPILSIIILKYFDDFPEQNAKKALSESKLRQNLKTGSPHHSLYRKSVCLLKYTYSYASQSAKPLALMNPDNTID